MQGNLKKRLKFFNLTLFQQFKIAIQVMNVKNYKCKEIKRKTKQTENLSLIF